MDDTERRYEERRSYTKELDRVAKMMEDILTQNKELLLEVRQLVLKEDNNSKAITKNSEDIEFLKTMTYQQEVVQAQANERIINLQDKSKQFSNWLYGLLATIISAAIVAAYITT